MAPTTTTLQFTVSEKNGIVSAIFTQPVDMKYLLVLAHGAGAGMTHPFMEQLSSDLAEQSIGVFRFNFPYMEQGKSRPNTRPVAELTIQKAIEKARTLVTEIPIFASGKSFGGRMTSWLAATSDVSNVKGLIFFGFPLHAAGKPSANRADHLKEVSQPMLFLQGTRDTLAQIPLIESVCENLPKATLIILEGADHSFKMLKRSGVTQEEMIKRLAKETWTWMNKMV